MKRVLVLGGYGGFGGRVARRLAADGFAVTVAGRSLARAAAFCERHPEPAMRPLAVDRSAGFGTILRAEAPWLVIDAAGPFQGQDYGVAEACIAARSHYIDLADARAFVGGIGRLDAAARAAGVAVIAGASSVPALSSAVADHLADDLDRVTAIDIALSASNRASGGVSMTRAILSYVGRPIALWRGGAWRRSYGWQEKGRVRFAVPGRLPLRRSVALCDVPDLDLLPVRYPGRPAVRFRAGTEVELQNRALWLLSWPVRWGWVRSLRALTEPGVWLQRRLRRIGGDRSAMSVLLQGWRGGVALDRRWTVLAEQGDGPWIPALAAPLLARKLANGLPPGARSAAGSLGLADFEPAFADFAIATATEESETVPLFARVMGDSFDRLPAAVRNAHRVNGELVLRGEARIARGKGLISRLIAAIMGFPPAAESVPVEVWMEQSGKGEIWRRDFGGVGFSSRLTQRGPLLVERFGLVSIGMALVPEADGFAMPIRRWWLGPVPMPLVLAPRSLAHERETDGLFHFDVPIALPLAGFVIHYCGWLRPAERSDGEPSGSKAGEECWPGESSRMVHGR